jgi:hypothetical protein
MSDMKQFEQFAEMMQSMMPKVKANKNGYELRTKVLEMAKDNVWSDYHAKFAGWEQTVKRDPETGEVVTTVTMPDIPGAEAVLETAQQFYDFVSNGKIKKD